MNTATATKKITKKARGATIFLQEVGKRHTNVHPTYTAFRAAARARFMNELELTEDGARVMFTMTRQRQLKANPELNIPRDPRKTPGRAKKAAVTPEDIAGVPVIVVPEGRWQCVDKVTGEVVAAAPSRRKAQAIKGEGQKLVDSAKA